MTGIQVTVANADDADDLAAFAQTHPLAWTDFASIAILQPDEPGVWVARSRGDRRIRAAVIDDGLAMSVAGDPDGLDAIVEAAGSVDDKLVVAGRTAEVRHVARHAVQPRRERPEHFMAVPRDGLRCPLESVPIRVATGADLPLLVTARVAALEEEYGIPVPPNSRIARELEAAVRRAVQLQGVAIWLEDGACAFTAQLVAKTPTAAMFGDLYVDPALRGAGRATRGLTAFCAWLMTESEHVALRVGIDNEPALRLYERVGFEVVDSFLSSLGADAPGGEVDPAVAPHG